MVLFSSSRSIHLHHPFIPWTNAISRIIHLGSDRIFHSIGYDLATTVRIDTTASPRPSTTITTQTVSRDSPGAGDIPLVTSYIESRTRPPSEPLSGRIRDIYPFPPRPFPLSGGTWHRFDSSGNPTFRVFSGKPLFARRHRRPRLPSFIPSTRTIRYHHALWCSGPYLLLLLHRNRICSLRRILWPDSTPLHIPNKLEKPIGIPFWDFGPIFLLRYSWASTSTITTTTTRRTSTLVHSRPTRRTKTLLFRDPGCCSKSPY